MSHLTQLYEALAIYLSVVNLITFFMYGLDKWKAKHDKWRIPEHTLLMLAAVGGSMGAWSGMYIWRHKTKHWKFRLGIPLILVAQVALAYWLLR